MLSCRIQQFSLLLQVDFGCCSLTAVKSLSTDNFDFVAFMGAMIPLFKVILKVL